MALSDTTPDSTPHLFPEGHPLHRLVRPSFDAIRRALRGTFVSTIWIDAAADPARAGFRPAYDDLYGSGASNVMSFVAAWLSTGPGTESDGNVALFPEGIDKTLVDYAQRVGLLGAFEMVPSVQAMKERVARSGWGETPHTPRPGRSGMRLYNIDDVGPSFDAHSMVSSDLFTWVSSKDHLDTLTSFGPSEVVKDMYEVSLADYEAAKRGKGRVFIKTSNTESAGLGVFIASSPAEFEAHLASIRETQRRFDLNRRLVIQPEIIGQNRSFQVFIDPRTPDAVAVVALTDQLVEADGKTYRSSRNHPITPEAVEPVGAAILDLVDHIRARHPEAFGFLMADYFATDEGPVIYDPGLRPTGNTATALAAHLAHKITGRPFAASLLPLATHRPGLTFADFARRAGPLADPANLPRERRALMPWGWNPIQGFGMVIVIAEDQASLDALSAEVAAYRYE